MSNQITTMTLFKYHGFKNKFWALKMMQFAHKKLKRTNGLSFYKVLGSGRGLGFNFLPDWSVYGLLQVWKNEESALSFFKDSNLFEQYKSYTVESVTVFLKNYSARGAWSGSNPFEINEDIDQNNTMISVITRATVKPLKLRRFWSHVPIAQSKLIDNKGLILTKGVGEIPILQMATFSIWKDTSSMEYFAKLSNGHGKASSKAMVQNWFKEYLFARFHLYKVVGSWGFIEFGSLSELGLDYDTHF